MVTSILMLVSLNVSSFLSVAATAFTEDGCAMIVSGPCYTCYFNNVNADCECGYPHINGGGCHGDTSPSLCYCSCPEDKTACPNGNFWIWSQCHNGVVRLREAPSTCSQSFKCDVSGQPVCSELVWGSGCTGSPFYHQCTWRANTTTYDYEYEYIAGPCSGPPCLPPGGGD